MANTNLLPLVTLRSAEDVREVAENAAEIHEMQQIAYAINTAANTGELCVEYNHGISDSMMSTLEQQGYTIKPHPLANEQPSYIISWK